MIEEVKKVLEEEIRGGLESILKVEEIDRDLAIRYVIERVNKVVNKLGGGGYIVLSDNEIDELIRYGIDILNGELRVRAIKLIEKLRDMVPDLEVIYIMVAIIGGDKFKISGVVFADVDGLSKEEFTKLVYHNRIVDFNNEYIIFKINIKDFDKKKYIKMDKKSRGLLSLVINILEVEIIHNVKKYIGIIDTIIRMMKYINKPNLN